MVSILDPGPDASVTSLRITYGLVFVGQVLLIPALLDQPWWLAVVLTVASLAIIFYVLQVRIVHRRDTDAGPDASAD